MRNTWWKSGQYNAICDVCGMKFKSVDLRQRWDGLMVCEADMETRHPQELIRPIQDQNKLPWTRPEPTDTFVSGSNGSTLNPNPQVAFPTIVLTSSGNIDAPAISDGTHPYPVGPVIIPVVLPDGISVTTITINPLWPAGSVVQITVNHPHSYPPVATTTPTDKYTVTWGWGVYPPPLLSFSVQPSTSSLYGSISPSIQVSLLGNLGVVVDNYVGDISLALAQSVGTLSGTLTVAAVAGVATFSGISLDEAGVGFNLIASAVNLTSVTSSAFNNVASLVFTQQPTDVAKNTSISPAVEITVQGAASETITSFVGDITMAIAINPGSPPGVLSGTLTQTAIAGVATFNDLKIDVAADSYALSASTTTA